MFHGLFSIVFIFGNHQSEAYCSVQLGKNGNIYALCNGTYTIESAKNECSLNGYELAQELNITSILSSFRLVSLLKIKY